MQTRKRKPDFVDAPLKTGITGGMGSGKTTACQIFEALGIPVYYSDERAKFLMITDESVRHKVISLFGPDSYKQDGALNRLMIAEIVFQDSGMLKKLNDIVHPAVLKDGEEWHSLQRGVPYTIKEAALLFESGSHKNLDKIIVITAPLELRIERVLKRDHISRKAVKARMEKQLPDEEKIRQADFVIVNDGSMSLVQQVWRIHQEILKLRRA